MHEQSNRLIHTVRGFSTKYPAWSQAALRNLIFAARPRQSSDGNEIPANGLGPAIIRCGRKLLIDETRFFEWLQARAAAAQAAEQAASAPPADTQPAPRPSPSRTERRRAGRGGPARRPKRSARKGASNRSAAA